jgi:hypothetical protein
MVVLWAVTANADKLTLLSAFVARLVARSYGKVDLHQGPLLLNEWALLSGQPTLSGCKSVAVGERGRCAEDRVALLSAGAEKIHKA